MNLFQIVNELRDIAERADKERLGLWVNEFKAEFPDLAEEIMYCAQMESPQLVLRYLRERDQRFALLGMIPNIEPTIQFLMNFIRERSQNANSHSVHAAADDEPWTVGRCRERTTPNRPPAKRIRS